MSSKAEATPMTAPAPTITAALEPDHVAVKLSLGFPAGTAYVSVWRVSTATGNVAYVRGWMFHATGASSAIIYDWEVPLGVEVVYYAQVYTTEASAIGSTAPILIGDQRDWLVDLARPTNTFPILIEALPAFDYVGPVGVHRILDRRDPILTTAPMWTPSGTLSFVTATRLERDRAKAILGNGVAFLLRTPPAEGVGNLYLGVLAMHEQRVSRFALHDDRRFIVEVVQVPRPDANLYAPVPPVTYADRLTLYPTYAAATATGDSYEEIAYTFPPGRVDPTLPWPPDDV